MRFIAILFILASIQLKSQDLYLSGQLSAYAYKYTYKGDYPFDPYRYTAFTVSTNQYVGVGYSFYQKHFIEVGISKVSYRYHFPDTKGVIYRAPSNCVCVTGPAYSTFPEDYKSATNFTFNYKLGILNPRHLNDRKSFQIFLVGGLSLQFNPKKDNSMFESSSEAYTSPNGYLVNFEYNRSDKMNVLLNAGIQVEKRILLKNLYLTAGFTEQFGMFKQMTTNTTYQTKGITFEGQRNSYGAGRYFSFGIRYYINKDKLIEKGLDSVPIDKGFFYTGFEFGTYRNKQTHSGSTSYRYGNNTIDKEDGRVGGVIIGYRKEKYNYEVGFYLRPDNMGYTVEKGPYFNSINYTSYPYLYIPLRFKLSVLSLTSKSKILEVMPSIGLTSNISLPQEVRLDEITYHSPDQVFTQRKFALGGEIGAELIWNFGKFRLNGFGRYMQGFQNTRKVSFSGIINNKAVSGEVQSASTGWWNGLGMSYRF